MEQQCKVFRRFLDTDSIIGLSSETPHGPLNNILEEKSVIVMTAGVLMNAIENKIVKISDIGLIVFDECHDCKVRISNAN